MTIYTIAKSLVPATLRKPLRKLLSAVVTPFVRGGLSQSQLDLLNLMRSDNAKSRKVFRESKFWIRTNKEISSDFSAHGIHDAPSQNFIHRYSTPVSTGSKWRKHAHDLLQSRVAERDNWGVLDAIEAATRKRRGEFNSFTWDQLISADSLISISEVNEIFLTEPVVVAEIGAGYGRMAEALIACNPQATYLIFDLPESLLVSSTYLPTALPGVEIVDYISQKKQPSIDTRHFKPGQLWFCGSHDLEKLSSQTIDVFLSIYTFQEMEKTQLLGYFDLIDRTTRGHFYTQQKWRASTPNEFPGIDEYPFNSRWNQEFIRDSTFSRQYFETCFSIDH